MFKHLSDQSFWFDELDWTIGIINNRDIIEIMNELLKTGYNLPLFYIITYLFYNIMPYGQMWIGIPNVIFVLFGIILLSKIGKELGGEKQGFLITSVSIISQTLIVYIAWELRPYAIMFFFSACTLFYFIKRLKDENSKNIIFCSISMLFFIYTHWFAAILSLFYMITDLFLWAKKRITYRIILADFIVGILFIPWVILVAINHVTDLTEYFGNVPKFIGIVYVIYNLLNKYWTFVIIFGLGCVLISIKFLKNLLNKKYWCAEGIWIHMVISILWVIIPTFIYSRYINPDGSIYIIRYFYVLLPQVLLITTYPINDLMNLKMGPNNNIKGRGIELIKKFFLLVVMCIYCYIYILSYSICIELDKIGQPYREVAQYLYDEKLAYLDNSIIITVNSITWIDYYFIGRGYDIPMNAASEKNGFYIINKERIEPQKLINEELLKYDYIYMFQDHEVFSLSLFEKIRENYNISKTIPNLRLTIYSKKL